MTNYDSNKTINQTKYFTLCARLFTMKSHISLAIKKMSQQKEISQYFLEPQFVGNTTACIFGGLSLTALHISTQPT